MNKIQNMKDNQRKALDCWGQRKTTELYKVKKQKYEHTGFKEKKM